MNELTVMQLIKLAEEALSRARLLAAFEQQASALDEARHYAERAYKIVAQSVKEAA